MSAQSRQHADSQILQLPIWWARRKISWVGPGQVKRVRCDLPAPLPKGSMYKPLVCVQSLHSVAGELTRELAASSQ